MNIFLCGLPMSGKTTLGRLLAKRLQWPFIDTDYCLERAYAEKFGAHYTCREIFAKKGEPFFRELEKEQIISLHECDRSVIALGGGTLLDQDNRQLVQKMGCLIYLKASLEGIWKRILEKGIPAYLPSHETEKAFHALAEVRIPLYEQTAHVILDMEKQQIWRAIPLEPFLR